VVLSVLLVLAILTLVAQNRRVTSLETRLLRLTRGRETGNLEEILQSHLDAVAGVIDDVDGLLERSAVLEARSERAFQRIGFVRFNPFEDTGSNQSFVLALLDGRDDGVVISSLHTRAATRLYAKTLSGGRSEGALSAEENRAVELARSMPTGGQMGRIVDARAASMPESTVRSGGRSARAGAPSSASSAGQGATTPASAPIGGTAPR
jgi:uncharacterized protein DUF4446